MIRPIASCLALAVLASVASVAAAQQKPGEIAWATATPELPKKREEGKAAEGPVEGPEKPQLRELDGLLAKGYPVLLYWWWPGSTGPGKACQTWKTEVFVEPEVPQAIEREQFVCLRVNAKICPPEVMKQYRVGAVPTMQLWTCDGKVAKAFSGAARDPKPFLGALASVSKQNEVLRKKREALRKKLEKEFERINKLKDDGQLAEARTAYEKLAKKHGADVAEDCKWGLKEIKMIEVAAEGETLFKQGKYLEAKGRLSLVADFEVPCPARDLSRKLLPECEVGVKIQEAEQSAATGKMLEAIEKLQAIVNDQWYDGPMKQVAKDKIAELKSRWGNG